MFEYYKVLDLDSNASLLEIKKAYRSKAKQYHPDVNKAPGAHERFIEINTAYQVLTDYKEGRFTKSYNQKQNKTSRSAYDRNNWEKQARARARAKAAAHAKMKYDEFIKSPLYKSALVLFSLIDIVYIIIGGFAIISPITFTIINGIEKDKIAVTIVAILFSTLIGGSMIAIVILSRFHGKTKEKAYPLKKRLQQGH